MKISLAKKWYWAAVFLAAQFTGLFASVQAQPVVIFAASSTKNAVDESLRVFKLQTTHAAVASYASSSALARQITNGAPADLFLSANQQWMQYLQDNSHLRADTQTNLTSNRLALIASIGANIPERLLPVRKAMPLLAVLGQSERIAMGDPTHVPLGQYGAAALRNLSVWTQLESRVVPAANARLALALVARGEAMLGIVYASDVIAQPNVQELALIDPRWHPPIEYPLAITQQSTSPTAEQLYRFLRSADGQAIFAKHGFGR